MKLTFIGGGNMSSAIIGRLVQQAHSTIHVIENHPEQIERLRTQWPSITVSEQISQEFQADDIIILAVKPQQLAAICAELAPKIHNSLVLSIAAGIQIKTLSRWLKAHSRIIRIMPNTPVFVGWGMSGLFAHPTVNEHDRDRASAIMQAVGTILWVDNEEKLDAVTAISGSGPAYVFYFLESVFNAAKRYGFSDREAKSLILTTMRGSIELAEDSEKSFATLREQVTSKGGTTEQAINYFNAHNLNHHLQSGIDACFARAQQLGQELDQN